MAIFFNSDAKNTTEFYYKFNWYVTNHKKKKKGNSNTNKLSCWNSSITAIITLYCKRFGVSLILFFFISNEASKIGDK